MSYQISKKEIDKLRGQGYSDQEISQAIDQYEDSSQGIDPRESEEDPRALSQQSSFASAPDDNLIKWQLELNDILERAEHILRGDVPTYVNGVIIWKENPNPNANPLNKTGIQEIMKILAMYINRNTILSDYDNSEINWKVFDFGRALNDYIFMKYDEIGMDTEEKRKSYGLLIKEIVDLVHSAYKRALHGGERRSLREMISVQQSQQMQSLPGQLPGVKERSMMNPARLFKGKYG